MASLLAIGWFVAVCLCAYVALAAGASAMLASAFCGRAGRLGPSICLVAIIALVVLFRHAPFSLSVGVR